MRVCFTDHARERLTERGVSYDVVRERVRNAGRRLDVGKRTTAVLVGQEPPIVVEFRPPARATVVTVLPPRAGAGGKVKLPC